MRYENREELEQDTERMRAEGWALWKVTAVPEEALIAQFIRRAEPAPQTGNRGVEHKPESESA